ncbi:hypothetical protein [Borreliella bavariensis]|nr:hypothetical protein [Borreliella bavariensis]
MNKNKKHNIMTIIFLGKIFNKECFNDDAKENVFNFIIALMKGIGVFVDK